jgi:DNA invertase Pin-like site-specific DNA recombinase
VVTVIGYGNDPGQGVNREEAEAALLATARDAGLELDALVWDESSSDSLAERPNLSEVITKMSPGTTLIVASISSLAEDILTQELRLRDMRAAGARILSCSPEESDYLNDDASSLAESSQSQSQESDVRGGIHDRGDRSQQ